MRGAVSGLCLLAAATSAAQAGALVRHLRFFHSARPLALTMHDEGAARLRSDAAPLLGQMEPHYQPRPSGLDRIDPSALRVWGAEIVGEGVKGGAVVSLTWPTD